jgi:arginine-tRNA-protein transferase
MESLFKYIAPPSSCGYLPGETWSLEYEVVAGLKALEYQKRLLQGWRRFGTMLFHPVCPTCQKCLSLRVKVDRFQPNRNQRRVRKINQGQVILKIGTPSVSRAKLDLYDNYHSYQTAIKGWPEHPVKDPDSYRHSFCENPFATQEWCFYLHDRLIGVGYVDDLPEGLSAIYFFYDPAEKQRSLGTWNVLCMVEECARRNLPYLYLGYYVKGCQSLEYKANFIPNEVLTPEGIWQPFCPSKI